MKKLLIMFMLANLTLLAKTEVEIITRATGFKTKIDYQNEINRNIKERESNGWKLIDIKGFLSRPYKEISQSEYILVFEK